MSRWTPAKRSDVIVKLRGLGFEGPDSGTRHERMRYGNARLILPSYSEYNVDLLRNVLRQAGNLIGRPITLEEWERL